MGVFRYQGKVGFAETDMAGIVHFSAFARWVENTEHAWFRASGLSIVARPGEVQVSWPRVQFNIDFRAPFRFEDDWNCEIEPVRWGKSSLQYEFRILDQTARICARGSMTIACVEKNGHHMRSTAVPESIKNALLATLEEKDA